MQIVVYDCPVVLQLTDMVNIVSFALLQECRVLAWCVKVGLQSPIDGVALTAFQNFK